MTPGGGVLKLTLSRRGPLKITTEAQNKKPDPLQTTVKTVYDPTKEEGPLQGGENVKIKGTSKGGEKFENQRIKPREAPNDKKNKNFPEDGGPIKRINSVVVVILMVMEDQIKAGNHLEGEKNHQMGLEE